MKAALEAVPLGEVLKRSGQLVALAPNTVYREVKVRVNGKGVVERRKVRGVEIASDRRFVAKAGQFIISRIDARHGASGLIPPELDGAIVTNDFPLFDIATHRLAPRFLEWMTKTASFVDLCKRASEGSTNRVRLAEERFSALTIHLPAIEEQHRIVAQIEFLATKVADAQKLRSQVTEQCEAFIASRLNQIFSEELSGKWPVTSLGDLSEIKSGVTLGRRLRGPTIRLPYLRVANVQDGRLDLSEIKEIDVLESEAKKWLLEPGDLLLTEGGDWDKLGRGTLWHGEIPTCIHQNHIFRVRATSVAIDPYFLSALVASPRGKAYFQKASKKTTNLASINQKQLRAFPVFQPPIAEQQRIVEEINSLKKRIDAVKTLQSDTLLHLDALLPAILDKAFRGDL